MIWKALIFAAGLGAAVSADARTLKVCPQGCIFSDIQAAVDAAHDGDTIRIGAGRYVPDHYRDITYGKLVIRGSVVLDHRNLTLVGEPGVVIDDTYGVPTSAFVVRGGEVRLRSITLKGFKAVDTKDDIYDGHGVFQIGGVATLENLTIEGVTKMALVVRENGQMKARQMTIQNNGVGVWIDETARFQLSQSLVSGNTYSGLAVYARSVTDLSRVTFANHTDDAVFLDGHAQMYVRNSIFQNNRPLAFNREGQASLRVDRSIFCHNEAVSKGPFSSLGEGNTECKE